eukprot:m.97938 g.97938  ORF g.97938 m.97938 type:complete len:412 (+) comp15063_c0_seq4:228-1463(+)
MGEEEGGVALAQAIERAVTDRLKNPQGYQELITEVGRLVANSDVADNQDDLALYFNSLTSVVSVLNKQTSDLVEQTLKVNLSAVRQEDVLPLVLDYYEALVSSCALYGQSIFKSLIHQTTYSECDDVVSEAALGTLLNIVQHVPSQFRIMVEVCRSECPFFRKTHNVLDNFFHNLFDMTLELPDLLPLTLELSVGTLLKLDLDTRDEPEEEEEEQGDDQDMFEMDMNQGDEAVEAEPEIVVDANSSRSKLDTLMQLALDFMRAWQEKHPDGVNVLWMQYKDVFLTQIITTYQSKRVQFLLFFLSSWQPDFVEDWLNTMVELTLDVSKHMPLRQAACGYMASYLARAGFMSHTYDLMLCAEGWLFVPHPVLALRHCQHIWSHFVLIVCSLSIVLSSHRTLSFSVTFVMSLTP